MTMQQFSTDHDVWNQADKYIQSTLPDENTVGLEYDEDDIVELYEKPVRQVVILSNKLSYRALEAFLSIQAVQSPVIEEANLLVSQSEIPHSSISLFEDEYEEWVELTAAFIYDFFAECSIEERLELIGLASDAIDSYLFITNRLYDSALKVMELSAQQNIDSAA